MVKTIDLIFHVVSCFSAIGGVILSRNLSDWIMNMGPVICIFYEILRKSKILIIMRSKFCLLSFFLLKLIVLEIKEKS